MKQTRESLGLDKIFALISASGELASSAKRHKLARQHIKLADLQQEYLHQQQFIQQLGQHKALCAKLEDIFCHLPELALSHFAKADCLLLHEFFELKSFLWQYIRLCKLLEETGLTALHKLPDLTALFSLLDPEGNGLPAFRISPLYSRNLSILLDKQFATSQQLKQTRLHDLAEAKQALELPNLKEEFVVSRNKQEEISRLLATRHFVVSSENLANYSFKLADSPAALAQKQELESLHTAITLEEEAILYELSSKLQEHISQLETAYHSTGELSWDYALAVFAQSYNCCIPELVPWQDNSFAGIELKEAVNLPLKLYLEANNRSYQALDISLRQATNLITGPNMGGKSTALITLGQLCELAALGIPLPAKHARLPIYNNVYYNHDSYDNSENLSSFGKEVIAFCTALQKKGRSLMLLDEFAKGTNPAEGEAICMAVIQYLSSTQHSLVAATHFTAPATLKGVSHFSIKGISEADFSRLWQLPEGDMKNRLKLLSEAMDYALIQLHEASPAPRCAVKIATILGMPEDILGLIENGEIRIAKAKR